MHIVIDLPDEVYELLKYFRPALDTDYKKEDDVRITLTKAVLRGTPLPKGHGDLKDSDEMKKRMGNLDGVGMIGRCIDEFPIIVEADKAESEEV